ncbi:MAG: hypothetical protein LBT20_03545 [Clostridiales bacterium]|jgi:hypothetical protein|nr:hypothetical protein [Clostridiales bacterium]
MKKISRVYSDTYGNRVVIGVKSKFSLLVQLAITLAGAGLLVLFLLPVLNGEELGIVSFIEAGVAAPLLIVGLIRLISWFCYPHNLIAVEPGKVIFFPHKRREIVMEQKDVLEVKLNDWFLSATSYDSYALYVLTKYRGRLKIKFVKDSAQVTAQLKRLKYNRIV